MTLANKIIIKNGKEFLKVSKPTWQKYLDHVSPYRNKYRDNGLPYLDCGLKTKYYMWCDTCNTSIGYWSNSCNFIISSINLQKYSDIFKEDELKNEIHVEIDRNDDKKTI